MQMKKTFKKMAAIGVGAAMIGATLTGALAQSNDLADYPMPFVEGGQLNDAIIVVGKNAATQDVLGAVDIAAGLQASAVSQIELETSSAVAPTVDDGVKVEKSGNEFNYDDTLASVNPEAFDDNDLPDLLAELEFNDDEGSNSQDETYDQLLKFDPSTVKFLLTTPDDGEAGSYIKIDEGEEVYNYTLAFEDSVTFDTDATGSDLEGNKITMIGKIYTITEASSDSNGNLDKLKLVAGDSTVWLTQDQPYTIGGNNGNTVTVVDVGNTGTKCGINVDGTTVWVSEGSTEDFGSLSVGVLDVIEVNTQAGDADTCELSLGSSELVLEDNKKITVNNVEIDGSRVTFTNASMGKWTGFTIKYDADDLDDDLHLAAGGAFTDPIFGNWKIEFAGVTATNEMMEVKASDDDATFTFTNNDGQEVEIPFHYDTGSTTFSLGTDSDESLLLPGEKTSVGDDIEKTMFLFTTSGGEAHVLELEDLDCTDGDITIVDKSYNGKERASEETITCGSGSFQDVPLGSLGTISLNITSTSVEYENVATKGAGTIETKYEGIITVVNATKVNYTEESDDVAISTVQFNFGWDSSDTEMEITPVTINGAAPTWVDKEDGDDDTKMAVTTKGTLLEYDDKEKSYLTIWTPEADAFANVFIAPLSASVSSGSTSGGTLTADKVNPFSVGLAVLDENAAAMSKNMIVVGGPCANDIAFEIMGSPANCADGFEQGKGMIKYFDRNNKAALLVAGFSADDTLGASYVLAHPESYGISLSGNEMEVVVTTLDQISANTV